MTYKSKYFDSSNVISGDVVISGSISAGAWGEGYLGNSEFIAVPPADFNGQFGDTTVLQTTAIELIATDDNGGSIHIPSNRPMDVNKVIPIGFKAVSAVVYGSAGTWAAALQSTATDANSLLAAAGQTIGATVSFTSEPIGTGTGSVGLRYTPSSASDELWGAQIFIEKV
tara:strand:- start:3313 stop:3822 length:510 start_codon:yes stop_codon:yes gene_type:complete